MMAAIIVVLLSLSVGTWWYTRQLIPAKPHDPVTVLIADFTNNTGDPAFDLTLEQTLRRALEAPAFISVHDRSRITTSVGVPATDQPEQPAARQITVTQSLGIVLSAVIVHCVN